MTTMARLTSEFSWSRGKLRCTSTRVPCVPRASQSEQSETGEHGAATAEPAIVKRMPHSQAAMRTLVMHPPAVRRSRERGGVEAGLRAGEHLRTTPKSLSAFEQDLVVDADVACAFRHQSNRQRRLLLTKRVGQGRQDRAVTLPRLRVRVRCEAATDRRMHTELHRANADHLADPPLFLKRLKTVNRNIGAKSQLAEVGVVQCLAQRLHTGPAVNGHVPVRPVLIARCASIADQTQGQTLRVPLQATLRQVLHEV